MRPEMLVQKQENKKQGKMADNYYNAENPSQN